MLLLLFIKTGIFGQPEPEVNFRIEIFAKVRGGQKDELGKLLPELVLLTAPNISKYFYCAFAPK